MRREKVSQEGEIEFTRVQKKIFFDTLFSEERTTVYNAESFVFLSSCLEEDCSTGISQMIFEHLFIICSVEFFPSFFMLELSRLFSSLV